MLSVKTIENLKNTPIGVLPVNEAQARPLTKLPTPELQQEAWKEAIELAKKAVV